MQFGLAHGALEAQEEPVIVLTRIVDAVLIDDEGVGEGANLDEAVPVAVVAREPGDLQAQDGASLTQAHRGHEVLEAVAARSRNTGVCLILVDDADLLGRPAQIAGALGQIVLARGAAPVLTDLGERGLPDVDQGWPREVVRAQFSAGEVDRHSGPPDGGERRGPLQRCRQAAPSGE